MLLLSGKLCWTLKMQWVPTSVLASPGDDVELQCKYEKEKSQNVDVTWIQIKWCQNISVTVNIAESEANLTGRIQIYQEFLYINNTQKNDSALYQCKVTLGHKTYKSCGTYLRIQEAESYAFFNIGETTKNRLITVEGVLLLLCTIIPGTFLLYKKRWENRSILNMSQTGDNLYEGLNLEQCSIYEDITRGLQATYEDVGSLRGTDIQLEKP
nr:CD79a.b [Xenopus laevis]